MKKFTKLFLSCAAVAALTGAIATSAMAADLTATYNEPEEGAATTTVDITCDSTDATKTLLVIKGTDLTSIDAEDIIQIDQAETIEKAIVAGDLEDGTYTVLMGGTSGEIYSGTFRIGSGGVLIGDVNLSGDITLSDATQIVLHKTSKQLITDESALVAADTNLSGDITMSDATCIVMYKVGKTDNAGHVGELN